MSSTVRVRINSKGARELLTSPGVQALLDRKAQQIADAAGTGFEVRRRDKRIRRYSVQIRTSTHESILRQADDNVLIKALDAGRA
nr:MAG TPA: type I neck protein [Caudoviricetes sp.]